MRPWRRPDVLILPATLADCDLLSDMHSAAFRRGWSGAEFEALLVQPGVQALIAECRTTFGSRLPTGFVLYRMVLDEAEIISVAIVRDWRGRGIATILLEEVLRRLYREGARDIHLEVEEGNEAAIGLYRRMDFRAIGDRPRYYAQGRRHPERALVMLRRLR